jgi:hypothetical protein
MEASSSLENVKVTTTVTPITLTSEQNQRIEAIRKQLGHLEPIKDELFTGDGNPDREIEVWDAIAAAFKAEAKVRSKLRKFDLKEQKLLLQVLLLTSIHHFEPGFLAQQFPHIKELKNFQGAVHRFMKITIDKAGPMPDLDMAVADTLPPEV